MKVKLIYRLAIAMIGFITMENTAIAQQNISHKNAEKWLKKGEWKNGLKLKVDNSVDADEFYKQYHHNKAVWDKVFTFLKQTNLDTLSPGKHIIDGDNAYASVTEGPSKEPDKATWESHKKYIDLQYVIKGKEKIEVADVSTAHVIKPYDAAKDVANYTANGITYTAAPGTFFLFFPQNAHKPNIKVTGYDIVKKLVIKIKVAE
ncbi:YhcH/YjgK/YiaL family protein [Mucilaginibacter segetis]|uniref:YhcH/YjgK/YiaL family protein n=1 Tax=Mucilaginibacter segetis TaxID=2793071 RepID=A0A934PU78_9SPHI|nr:YhcH/YjgK/YiaL family protein [Mucilaginibacter segetis]MBK0379666.1 YhcH/YjgK/YiaL family protein [Mucilaginibacter segetis]